MALKNEDIETIIINNNPETVSTDYDISVNYFEPITLEDVMSIINKKTLRVVVQFEVKLLLTLLFLPVKEVFWEHHSIDRVEDRERFTKVLNKLGIAQRIMESHFHLKKLVKQLNKLIPCTGATIICVRVRAMIVYDDNELKNI